MSVEKLMITAPPPEVPAESGSQDKWSEVEQALGTKLPGDYKEMINIYGTGCFGNYIYPYNPFSPAQDLVAIVPAILELYNQGRIQSPEYHCPVPSYPASGGLLPWGSGEDSELLCWRTEGPIDRWSIVVLDNHYSEQYFECEYSLTDFLVEWLNGELVINVFPDDIKFARRFTAIVSS